MKVVDSFIINGYQAIVLDRSFSNTLTSKSKVFLDDTPINFTIPLGIPFGYDLVIDSLENAIGKEVKIIND